MYRIFLLLLRIQLHVPFLSFCTLLSINNLSFYFGARPLYENANLHIRPKDRIGLIGQNGTGKSTLLRLITGEYQPDEGNISKSNDCTIGFLNQDLLSYLSNESILQVAMQAFEEQNKLQDAINQLLDSLEKEYSDDKIEKLATLQEKFETLGGYTLQAQTGEILEGLGFRTQDLDRPLQEFSGGWRMRVMLAKMLLQRPALLMLDEPTNHLDLPSIEWLENYLRNYEGAVLIVSHDRTFLNNVSNVIVEISGRKLTTYTGDYNFYLEEKELRRTIQQSAYENQQAQIRQTERFIERFRAKASKSRQVQSRVKALERLDLVEEVMDETVQIQFKFTFTQPSGRQVVELENIHKSYGDVKIVENTTARIERGDKIALIGANGKGKSTLLRILGNTEAITGKREFGHNVRTTFFAQHQLEALTLENTLLEELQQSGSNRLETELRNILGCFLFAGEEVYKKIKILSGGEKSRVALAKMLISDANFLLLDEPTNHLDMQSVSMLMQALQKYEGSFVVVSHDRHFVANIANKIWFIEDYQIKEYPGTYNEYVDWQQKRLAEQKLNSQQQDSNKKKNTETKPKKSLSQQQISEHKKTLKEKNQRLNEVENTISKLEKQKQQIEQQLAQPEIYQDKNQLQKYQQGHKKTAEQLNAAQTEWEKIAEEIDQINSIMSN